jgi:hypothetical protein
VTTAVTESVFAKYKPTAYPHTYRGTLHVARICGGTPSDPKTAEGWIRTKAGETTEAQIQAQIAETMAERGVSADEAAQIVSSLRHLNGFKRDENGLYIGGRQLKAAIKEAANVRWPKDRWGPSRKGTLSFFAEHVFVMEDKLHLGRTEPTGIEQRFVHTWRGAGIQYEEYCDEVDIEFTVTTDYEFTTEQWAMLWLTGEQQGIGATRSQGYGRYAVTRWERI